MRDREKKIATRYGLLNRLALFEKQLLAIPGITGDGVDMDLDGWLDGICQVIIVPSYHIDAPVLQWFQDRAAMIEKINKVAAPFGLHRTPDRLEDYGEHLYIVYGCDVTWPKP